MKKIGIITYHHHSNYGTMLQAYALQNYLSRKSDCTVQIIDYTRKDDYVGSKLILTRIKRLGAYIKDFPKYYTLYKNRPNQQKKDQAFESFFINHMVVSNEKADTLEQLPGIFAKYDAVMVGSDQTWNPFVAQGGDFLLDYFDGQNVKKLTYAPSIGVSKIPEQWIPRYKNALSDFSALSCRERGGSAFLSELLERDVTFVADPTLLLTPSDWEEIAAPIDVKEPYLLTYFLGDNKAHRKAAAKIAKEKNLRIVALPVSYLEIQNKSIDQQYVGPGGFISLIKNASFVCTDSFHGTMFSINFGKDFISFPKRDDVAVNSDNNRLYDALQVFGLENRLCIGGNFTTAAVDYEAVNAKLDALRENSKRYLDNTVTLV